MCGSGGGDAGREREMMMMCVEGEGGHACLCVRKMKREDQETTARETRKDVFTMRDSLGTR